MKIEYVSPLPFSQIITGGQIYDNNFLNVLEKDTLHNVCKVSLHSEISNSLFPLAPFFYLFKGLKNLDGDMIVTNSSHYMRLVLLPFFLKKFKKKKLATIHHHFMYRQFAGFKRKIYKFFEWHWLRSMDTIICASPYVYDELKLHFPEDKIRLFQIPFEVVPKLEAKPVKGNLTYTGTIEQRKGLIYLIKSLVYLKDQGIEYPLTIIGKIVEPEYYNNIKAIIDKYNLDVKFTGFISFEEIGNILASTDVFVFPSLLEGYGMSLVEAQVYGLPIVSFDNSAMPYTIKDGENGFTIPTGNVENYAEAIKRIVEDRALREKFSKGALQNVRNQKSQEDFRQSIIKVFSSPNLQ